jgi:hypothetical protein
MRRLVFVRWKTATFAIRNAAMDSAPTVFISYSHDSEQHRDWVESLARRLLGDGIEVELDQHRLRPGAELPLFMERGIDRADRVLVICTPNYVARANARQGGVGFENMLLAGDAMVALPENRVIPLIRAGGEGRLVPSFLRSRVYLDFRDDALFETRYMELLRELHGLPPQDRPVLGPNPFAPAGSMDRFGVPTVGHVPGSDGKGLMGTVTFDYGDHDGSFVIGTGALTFTTVWSQASNSAIHAYRDAPGIRSVALATGIDRIEDIRDVRQFKLVSDANSSRTRTPKTGEVLVWENQSGALLATQVVAVNSRSHGDPKDSVTLRYVIAPPGAQTFLDPVT